MRNKYIRLVKYNDFLDGKVASIKYFNNFADARKAYGKAIIERDFLERGGVIMKDAVTMQR
jgi:hypothetical protein